MAERQAKAPKARGRSVRTQTVLVACAVVGVTLVIAGITMVVSLRGSLTENVEVSARQSAQRIVAQLESGIPVEELALPNDDDEFVQVIASSGDVVAATANVGDGGGALTEISPGESSSVDVSFDDDPFLVVAVPIELPDGRLEVIAGRSLDGVVESTSAVVRILVVGLPLLLVVVGAVTWRVTGRALAPVETIRTDVESITSEKLDSRVSVPEPRDEIARLAGTMNSMLDRLEDGQQRERRFVSDASHELRSPVAAIRQHVEVALAHPESSSVEALSQSVLSENLRLQRLVDDLLILARAGEGGRDRAIPVDLDDVVFEEAERTRKTTRKIVDVGRVSAGRVVGDKKQLSRLVANLLENAVRHATSRVDVSLVELGHEVVLAVADDGPGIPVGERERVFHRFVRLDEARDRDAGGAGLGLSIVAEVARFHRGVASISDSDGGGARIEVRLPRSS